jgi:type I restriction enzyme, R subunit
MVSNPEYIYSELPAIELFKSMDYQYYDASKKDERESIYDIILTDRLKAALKRINKGITESALNKAIDKISGISATSLIEANQQVWELIRGKEFAPKQIINGKEEYPGIAFIDYEKPENNDFLIVNQMKFSGKLQNSIPDIVVYVNGLPIAVIECKSPTAVNAMDKAMGDLDYYQKSSEQLFHYNQLCVGICKRDGKYGAINAKPTYYSYFKTKIEDNIELEKLLGRVPTQQDILIYNLFEKEKLLDIIRNFVIFEYSEGILIKKLPRYQQIRATNKTIEKLQQHNKGGVIWHTQGSGKSITMAYISRKLQADENGFNNPTILIMTDRVDLDNQITDTFNNIVGFKNINHANSVVHLEKLLRNTYGGIITTTVQKFQEQDKATEDTTDITTLSENESIRIEKEVKDGKLIKITKELNKDDKWEITNREEILIEQLSTKENLYILVDEAHRSQYGFLAAFMRTSLPNAKFIAFTGTPISKEDKSTLGEFYGGDYIDVYTIKESVDDGATVELKYDQGIALLDVKKKELDAEFEENFGHYSTEKQEKLKRHALKKYQLSKERIRDIATHIIDHYKSKIYPDRHKAFVVTDGRHAALRYKQAFEELKEEAYHNFRAKVVISIGSVKSDSIAKDYYQILEYNRNNPANPKPLLMVPSEKVKEFTENFKLPFGNEEEREKSGKLKYNNDAIVIVSDMLLTGYDCPVASCLYIDKSLREHNLLQAIARVNRSKEGKHAGFIMDYFGITENLIHALEIFSGDLIRDDVMRDLSEEFARLDINHAKLVDFFKPIKIDRKYEADSWIDAAILYLEPIDLRDQFIDHLKQFNKSIGIVLPDQFALKFQSDFKLFNRLKAELRNAYPDSEVKITDEESKKLQEIIDEHLKSDGVENLLQEPFSIFDKKKFKEHLESTSANTVELKIRNTLKYTIKVGMDKDPDFFRPLAERLEKLIQDRKEGRITQLSFLENMFDINEDIKNKDKEGKDKGFVTDREIVVYNTMKTIFNGDSENATKSVFEAIKEELNIIGWKEKATVRKAMQNKIMHVLMVKMERSDARDKASEIVEIISKN